MSTDRYPEISMDETRLVPSQNTLKPEWPKKIRNLTAQELDRLMIDSDGRFYWDGKPVSYAENQPEASAPAPAPAQAKPVEGPDEQALKILDRAVIEIAERTPPSRPAEPAKLTEAPIPAEASRPIEESKPAGEMTPVEETNPAKDVTPVAEAKSAEEPMPMAEAQSVEGTQSALEAKPIEPIKSVAEVKLVAQLKQFTDATVAAEKNSVDQSKLVPPVVRPLFDDRVRLTLSGWQSFGLGITILAFLIGASGVAAYGWVTAHDWSCRLELMTKYCPAASPAPSPTAKPLPRPDIPS